MTQSRQTPRVWSDAIRGSEILSNWVKLGTSAVLLWLSIGIALGTSVGGWWFLEGTTSLDRRLWIHHVRNGLGIGGRIADLPNPDGSGRRIQVPKDQLRRYTWRSYQIVSRRFRESVLLGFLFWTSVLDTLIADTRHRRLRIVSSLSLRSKADSHWVVC